QSINGKVSNNRTTCSLDNDHWTLTTDHWPLTTGHSFEVAPMADPNQVLTTPEPAGAETGYRPLSGLAIAGFALAILYALVVLVSTVVGLIQGLGFFLPNELLLAPIAGAILCFLGQRQIRRSEGTKAGLALARWGLWLSVFTGLGYFSYYQFTY